MILLFFRNLHPATRRLLIARTLRSVGQGALVVDFSLYLHALHRSGLAIGLVLSGSGLLGAGLSLLVGLSSDRLGRKPFLLFHEAVSLLCSIAALFSAAGLLPGLVQKDFSFLRTGRNEPAGPEGSTMTPGPSEKEMESQPFFPAIHSGFIVAKTQNTVFLPPK